MRQWDGGDFIIVPAVFRYGPRRQATRTGTLVWIITPSCLSTAITALAIVKYLSVYRTTIPLNEHRLSQGENNMTAIGPFIDKLPGSDLMISEQATFFPKSNDLSEFEVCLPYFVAIGPELAWSSQCLASGRFDCYPDPSCYQETGIESNGDHIPDNARVGPTESHINAMVPFEDPSSPISQSISGGKTEDGQSHTNTLAPTRRCRQTTEKVTGTCRGSHTVASNDKPKRPVKKSASLERNRKSAIKSRRRNKEWEQKLATKKGILEARHSALRAEYGNLLRETLELKNDLIRHAGCHDDKVDAWIGGAAEKFARRQSGAKEDVFLEKEYPSNNHCKKGPASAFVNEVVSFGSQQVHLVINNCSLFRPSSRTVVVVKRGHKQVYAARLLLH
ncbi:bZIP transcription factor domain-containing protein [Pochonia chlamydosporia 170]|uniref:BZIP transcription factor domain-containing protein n=1 Tax=Pochonia chlamydosporia 170 TaxID=1380566 RepID=A0A179GAF5_METCM|nr:bZIP transcription factor domain-containing protein [Pochonia chlamydosporia 170]OAQ74363.1 bZIP transcription factor domain-containing protein [Pochonia chlamydosporia 170]